MQHQDPNPHAFIQQRPLLCARFEVIAVIGEGAAGVVYRVRDRERNNQEMALKVLTNQIAFDEHTIERFRDELRICRELRHPHLIEAYDLIHREDTVAFTMEFVEGSDLGKEFKRRSFSSSEIDKIFIQLLSALSALHERGVLHRDIKLENIMLKPDGSIKLSDLGLMKQYEKKMTKTGVLLGTAQYFPPEYVRTGKYDVRAEIFGVGVMLFEFMSGARWLTEYKGAQVITKLLELKFRFPFERLVGVEEKYRYILERALQYEAKKRFQSAKEMSTAFELPSLPSGIIRENEIERVKVTGRLELSRAERNYLKSQRNSSTFLLLAIAAGIGALMVVLLYGVARTGKRNEPVTNQSSIAPEETAGQDPSQKPASQVEVLNPTASQVSQPVVSQKKQSAKVEIVSDHIKAKKTNLRHSTKDKEKKAHSKK